MNKPERTQGSPTPEVNLERIFAIHAPRHPHTSKTRIGAEVMDYLRRVQGLPPDARSALPAAWPALLAALSPATLRAAYAGVLGSDTDITRLYRA